MQEANSAGLYRIHLEHRETKDRFHMDPVYVAARDAATAAHYAGGMSPAYEVCALTYLGTVETPGCYRQ